MSSRKNIGLAQFCEFLRDTITSSSRLKRRYILSYGIDELFHLITNKNFKIAIEEKTPRVVSKESVDAHAVDAMVVWHLLCKRNSSCFVCTFCFTTIDSLTFKANGFVCHMACKLALKSPISFFLFYMKNLSIYLLVW